MIESLLEPPRIAVGTFLGPVRVEWVREDRAGLQARLMKLLEDVSFYDAALEETFTARAGLVFDGASIPRWLWPTEGSPFTGDYREAAVIHDQLCKDREPGGCDKAHEVFLHAMLATGLPEKEAHRKYNAVRLFSRW